MVRYEVGYDVIDLISLSEHGIPFFCNVPDYGTEEVADSVCAMVPTVSAPRACEM